MENDKAQRWGGLFHFKWAAFDSTAGLNYAIGIVIVYILSTWFGASWFVAGICALLCWLTDVPGLRKNRVLGMTAFAVGGAVLTLLAGWLGTDLVQQVAGISVVAFTGTLLMLNGQRAFMVGWCLTYWFLLALVLIDPSKGPSDTVISLLIGSGVVILLTIIAGLFNQAGRQEDMDATQNAETTDRTALQFVLGYAFTLALVMAICLYIGSILIESDYTWVANAAFMVIGPNSRQTWISGLERAVGAVLGIIVGFYLFQYVQGEIMIFILGVVLSYLSLSLMNVSPAAFIFFFLIYMSHGWVSQGLERANIIANERILAELIGVLVACMAISVLQWWATRKKERIHVRAEQSGL